MDFLDPKKQKAHRIRMAVGYTILALALLLATTILLYQAYGFGIDKNGRVIQNGLVFVSSQPSGAGIYINGAQKGQTNTRLVLAAGAYTVQIKRNGYHTWQRAITVDGGSVERFDYPFLFPYAPSTTVTKQYTPAPAFATQSPNRQWLLVQTSAPEQFDLFDLSATKPVAKPYVVPTTTFAAGTTTSSWQLVNWSDDNRHVLLKRLYQKNGQASSEYILLDRQDANQTQNLTTALGFNPTTIELKDGAYDQYYLYDQNAQQVLTATLKKSTPTPFLQDVRAFTSDGTTLLYVTPDGAQSGKVVIHMRQGDKTYALRQVADGTPDLLALANYSGTRYVAVGAQSEGKVYVYQDPASTLDSQQVLVPVQILKTPGATTVSFSTSARFVAVENAQQFSVYDAETGKGYAFTAKAPIDAPQTAALWMDGFRLAYVSDSKLEVLDFDGTNVQSIAAANSTFPPFFSPDYHTLYTMNAAGALTSTALQTP
ncbi:MAG TPA: PEGA domain-containing protein [Candidatus Saccharimonadales bacterium]|nr:PEGA domain-containing protein [Candidatus Saccharimonadales bacterium]